jgi:hypothetical protein
MAEAESQALVRLHPADLEVQARILVHKRYGLVASLIPLTCAGLENRSWHLFAAYSREGWPADASEDALAFCEWLRGRGEYFSAREHNRLRFIAEGDGAAAFHWVKSESARWLPSIQLLFRDRRGVSEFTFSLRL